MGEIAWNIMKVDVHSCLSNGHSILFSNLNSKKSLKIETSSYGFDMVGIKGVKTYSNVVKVGVQACYPTHIQIYDQISILRSWSNVKLCHSGLLGFGLKEVKIDLNIVKLGMHSYIPNGHLNI